MERYQSAVQPITLAVTYKCNVGHHSIRYWRVPARIPQDVPCGVCGWPALIPRQELERHARLRTHLAEWLA